MANKLKQTGKSFVEGRATLGSLVDKVKSALADDETDEEKKKRLKEEADSKRGISLMEKFKKTRVNTNK